MVVLVLSAMFYYLLPRLVPELVRAYAGEGVRVADVARPTADGWRLGELQLTGAGYRARLRGVQLTYDLWDGTLGRLVVEELDATIVALAGEGGADSAAPELPETEVRNFRVVVEPYNLSLEGSALLTGGGALLEVEGRLNAEPTLTEQGVDRLAVAGSFDVSLRDPQAFDLANLEAESDLELEATLFDIDVQTPLNVRRTDRWRVTSEQLDFRGNGWIWRAPLDLAVSDDGQIDLMLGDALSFAGALKNGEAQGGGTLTLAEDEFEVIAAYVGDVTGHVAAEYDVLAGGGLNLRTTHLARVTVAGLELPPFSGALQREPEGLLRLQLTGGGLRFDPVIELAEETRLEGSFRMEVNQPVLAQWLGWEEAYDLTAGKLEGELQATSGDVLRYRVQGTLTEGHAHYDDIKAQGISGGYELQGEADRWRASLQGVAVAEIDTGVVVSDVQFEGAVTPARVVLDGLSGALLGGAFAVDQPLAYDIDTGRAAFEVGVLNIDLAEVVALEGQEIRATGRLSGTLPIEVAGDAVTIQHGALSADGGGIIQLSEDLSRSVGQPGLDFALRALEDFRYSVLSTTVDYAGNGDLAAGIRLEGFNPAIENGRAIHYNLNISENVPVLLESLRLQDEVTRQVERRVNQRGKP